MSSIRGIVLHIFSSPSCSCCPLILSFLFHRFLPSSWSFSMVFPSCLSRMRQTENPFICRNPEKPRKAAHTYCCDIELCNSQPISMPGKHRFLFWPLFRFSFDSLWMIVSDMCLCSLSTCFSISARLFPSCTLSFLVATGFCIDTIRRYLFFGLGVSCTFTYLFILKGITFCFALFSLRCFLTKATFKK